MEFEQKKLAIEQGLTPFLSGEPLANALRLWEAKYSRGHTFALTGFISELGDGATLAAPPAIVLPIPETALTRLVNLAYVGLCEYVGPVKADRVLHEAVLMVETASAGSGFPVRRLL